MKRLVIARHAETEENVNKIFQGQTIGGILTEKGKLQSQQLAKRLREENLDAAFFGDSSRMIYTANDNSEYHPSIPFIKSEKLKEISFGDAEGKKYSDCSFLDFYNAETESEIMDRAKSFLEQIPDELENILIVTGSGFIIALVANILNESYTSASKRGEINNTSVTIFDSFPKLEVYGSTEHLD
jgi:broad specificity phosphatase PhoE